jgi:hypothetical protein
MAARAGRRDGRNGVPSPDSNEQPPHIRYRVGVVNAWMAGPVERHYVAERNRLQAIRNLVFERAEALEARLDSPHEDWTEPAGQPGTPEIARAPRVTVRDSVGKSRGEDEAVITRLSTPKYLALLIAIFACEGIVNKKAFELFSERDAVLWLMVSGLAVGIIIASHLMGRSWKRVEEERRGIPILMFLAIVGLAASCVLGTMRFLTVDNARQERVRTLTAQVQGAQAQAALYSKQAASLQHLRHLRPAQRNALTITRSRLADAQAELIGTRSLLDADKHPHGIDRAIIAVPLFVFLNIFLMGVAVALGYYHFDPEAERVVAARRQNRRLRWAERIRVIRANRRLRREEKRQRRDTSKLVKEAHKQLGRDRDEAKSRDEERHSLKRQLGDLRAFIASMDNALGEVRRQYVGACAEAEKRCEGMLQGRYWTVQNAAAQRRPRKMKEAWERASLRAVKRGQKPPAEPPGTRWLRPNVQGIPLPFERPPELQ